VALVRLRVEPTPSRRGDLPCILATSYRNYTIGTTTRQTNEIYQQPAQLLVKMVDLRKVQLGLRVWEVRVDFHLQPQRLSREKPDDS
jgi:hypothetical protein